MKHATSTSIKVPPYDVDVDAAFDMPKTTELTSPPRFFL